MHGISKSCFEDYDIYKYLTFLKAINLCYQKQGAHPHPPVDKIFRRGSEISKGCCKRKISEGVKFFLKNFQRVKNFFLISEGAVVCSQTASRSPAGLQSAVIRR